MTNPPFPVARRLPASRSFIDDLARDSQILEISNFAGNQDEFFKIYVPFGQSLEKDLEMQGETQHLVGPKDYAHPVERFLTYPAGNESWAKGKWNAQIKRQQEAKLVDSQSHQAGDFLLPQERWDIHA